MYFTNLQMLESSNSVKRTYHQESRDLFLVSVQLCDFGQIILLLSWAHHMFTCKMKGLDSITPTNTPELICKILCIYTVFQGERQLHFKLINSSSASADSQREVIPKMVVCTPSWVQVPAPPLTGCLIIGRLLHFSNNLTDI